MGKDETPKEIKCWFLNAIQNLSPSSRNCCWTWCNRGSWPVAAGSIRASAGVLEEFYSVAFRDALARQRVDRPKPEPNPRGRGRREQVFGTIAAKANFAGSGCRYQIT
jgi:hypothetical protein